MGLLRGAPRKPRSLSALFLLIFLFQFADCATTAERVPDVVSVPSVAEFHPAWKPIFEGVELARGLKMAPDPQAVDAVRIDLRAPGIEFFVTPSHGKKPLETDAEKTSTFLTHYHCQVAINASPFSPVRETEGTPEDILGLSVSRGDVYSNAKEGHGALLITKDNKATISEPPYDLKNVYNAVGGFGMLLRKGQCATGDGVRHPRTAAGLSQDGRYLYFLVIDGRQAGRSVGATIGETAAWLQQLGAYTAVNLDGGGSTCLVMDDGAGAPEVINRPIHDNIPGNERANGNSLGVFAKGLKRH